MSQLVPEQRPEHVHLVVLRTEVEIGAVVGRHRIHADAVVVPVADLRVLEPVEQAQGQPLVERHHGVGVDEVLDEDEIRPPVAGKRDLGGIQSQRRGVVFVADSRPAVRIGVSELRQDPAQLVVKAETRDRVAIVLRRRPGPAGWKERTGCRGRPAQRPEVRRLHLLGPGERRPGRRRRWNSGRVGLHGAVAEEVVEVPHHAGVRLEVRLMLSAVLKRVERVRARRRSWLPADFHRRGRQFLMVVASKFRRRILHVFHLQAGADVHGGSDAVIEPGIQQVLIAVGDVESPELLGVAEPRAQVRRGRGRHRSERNAVELGQWRGHEVAAATTSVLVADSEGARCGIAVDVAEPHLVFRRLVAFAVLAVEILALERAFQAVRPIDAVVGRDHRVLLAILVGSGADRHVPGTRRQAQTLSGGVITASAVVAGVQRTRRIVANGQVRRDERPSRAIVQQASPLPRDRVAGHVLGAVVGIEIAELGPQGQCARGIQDDPDVGQRRVDLRIGGEPAQRVGRVPHVGRRHAVDGAARQRFDRGRNQVVVLLRTAERQRRR